MTWQWADLAFFSLTLLPTGLAMVTGHMPERLRPRLAAVQLRSWAVLARTPPLPSTRSRAWPAPHRRSSWPLPPSRASWLRPDASSWSAVLSVVPRAG